MSYGAYLVTTTDRYQYAGRTSIRPQQTVADAVRERLAEHSADPRSPLYGFIQATFTSYGPYAALDTAIRQERALYDGIPPARRLNRQRP